MYSAENIVQYFININHVIHLITELTFEAYYEDKWNYYTLYKFTVLAYMCDMCDGNKWCQCKKRIDEFWK